MSLLEAENLVKVYVKRGLLARSRSETIAVDDVSFAVERGETLALVGESGAGKSTAGRLVTRLISADSGSVRLDGVELMDLSRSEMRAKRRSIQMIFQDPYSSLDPRISVGMSLTEPLKVHFGANKTDRENRAGALLERVGLTEYHAERYPYELSGGQLQRVAIARALTVEPSLIVCDEPVAALDVSVRAQVLNLMLDLQDDLGISYLFISHDLSIVECIADRVAVMRHGKLLEYATKAQVYDDPQNDYTKELLAAIPVADPSSPMFRTGGLAAG